MFCGVHSTIVSSSLELSHGCSVLYPVCRWIVFHSCVRKKSMTWRWYEPFSPAPSPLLALLIHRRPRRWHVQIPFVCVDIWPSDAHCCNMGTAIKHPVPDRVIPSFVIFDIRALRRSALSVRVPAFQKLQNGGLTRSGTDCFIAVPMCQQWPSEV